MHGYIIMIRAHDSPCNTPQKGRITGTNFNEASMYSSLRHKHPMNHVIKTHGFSIIKPHAPFKVYGKHRVIKGPVHLDIEMDRGEMTLDEYIRHAASTDEIARNMWWIFVDLIHCVYSLHKQVRGFDVA